MKPEEAEEKNGEKPEAAEAVGNIAGNAGVPVHFHCTDGRFGLV